MEHNQPNVSDVQIEAGSQTQGSNANEEIKNSVSYETYSKLLSQHKKVQSTQKEMQQQLAQLMAEKEAAEKSIMEEQNKYKELYEKESGRVKEAKQAYEALQRQLSDDKKRVALMQELGGVRRNEYLQFAKIDQIQLLDDGSVDAESLKEVAAQFRLNHSDLLMQTKTVPHVDAKQANISGKISYEEWLKLPVSEQKKQLQNVKE